MNMSRRISRTAMLVAAAAALGLSAQAARAVDIVLDDYSLEVQHRSNTGVYSTGQAQPATGMRLGYQSGFGGPDTGFGVGGIESILYFKLPAIPAGQQVSTASLAFSVLKSSAGVIPNYNIDLYGLGFDKNSPPSDDGAHAQIGIAGVTPARSPPRISSSAPTRPGPVPRCRTTSRSRNCRKT